MRPGGTKPRRRGGTKGLSLAAAACLLGACGGKNFENENDRLRRLTLEQQDRIGALEAERGELEAKLAEAERAREAALPAEVLDAIPRCAGISLDRLSGLQRTDGAAKIIAYVEPFDGRQRFVQIVGALAVDAILAGPPGESGQPVTVSAALGPADLREAYRTALTGYYYLVELPVEAGTIPAEGTVTVRARFVDALTGLTHDAEATSAIR